MKVFKTENICGVQLNRSNLSFNDFQKVKAGHKSFLKVIIGILGIIIVSLSSIIPVFSGVILAIVVDHVRAKEFIFFLEWIIVILYIIIVILTGVIGLKIKLINIVVSLTVISAIIGMLFEDDKAGVAFSSLFVGLSIIAALIGVTITALFTVFSSILWGNSGELLALFGATFLTTISSITSTTSIGSSRPKMYIFTVTFLAAIAVLITGAITARQAVRGSPKFTWIREKAVFWAATGGTSFCEADLTDACFDGADLPHTDFRKAILTRTSFEGVTGLEISRLQGTILEQPKVRKLLISKIGCDEDYTGANFNAASLKGANLTGANLTEVQALDADFSGATLTDACIQGWNINKNTCFKNVICKRIFLKGSKQGNKLILSEQKPDSGEFQPGEFEKWINEIQNTVDLIFRKGLNWRAFMFSLAQTAIEHEGLDLSRYSITRKDETTVFTQIGVFPGADNAAIHQAFQRNYEYAEKAIEAKYQLVLQAKNNEIERLRGFAESNQQILKELMSIAAGTGRQVLIQGESHKVYLLNQAGGEVEIMESKKEIRASGDVIGGDKGDKITIGGDKMTVTGSSITLGDLNGQVNNTIQQLKDVKADSSDDLAKILTNLQEAINSDAALPEGKKKEALDAVQTIAEEAQKPPSDRILKLCTMAVNALTGITTAVTDASKLTEVLTTHLPTLTRLLGI